MFQAELSKYAKFDKNPSQTHENIRPQNCQFSQKACRRRRGGKRYNKLWLGNIRKIPSKKAMHAIAGKISGDFHSCSLGCKFAQSNFLFSKEGSCYKLCFSVEEKHEKLHDWLFSHQTFFGLNDAKLRYIVAAGWSFVVPRKLIHKCVEWLLTETDPVFRHSDQWSTEIDISAR